MLPFRHKLTLLIAGIVSTLLLGSFISIQLLIEGRSSEKIRKDLSILQSTLKQSMAHRDERIVNICRAISHDPLIVNRVLRNQELNQATIDDLLMTEVMPKVFSKRDLTDPKQQILLVIDPEGNIRGSSTGSMRIAEMIRKTEWFADCLEGYDAAGHLFIDGDCIQLIGTPVVENSREVIGIIIVGMRLGERELRRIRGPSELALTIFQKKEITLSTNWFTQTPNLPPQRLNQAFERIVNETNTQPAANMPTQTKLATIMGERFLYRMIHDGDGFVPDYGIIKSLDRELAFVKKIRNAIYLIAGVGLLLTLIAAFIFSASVTRPIDALQNATREIEHENYDYRVTISTRDEFKQLGDAFNQMIAGLAERERIRSAFSKSVSTEIATYMLKNHIALGGERRRGSILFSDIRGFTALAETLEEQELLEILNRYFTCINACIGRHQGNIDKFMGDAVMALFGIPIETPDHPLRAVTAALDMLEALDEFNAEMKTTLAHPIQIGIGINTGLLVAGLMGSEDRLNYTVLGDAVNTASRLEGLSKQYQTPIIIGEETYQAIMKSDGFAATGIVCRKIELVQVKGKSVGIYVYDVLPRSSITPDVPGFISRYQTARQLFRQQNLPGAIQLLEGLHNDWPEDGPTKVLLERYRSMNENLDADNGDPFDSLFIAEDK